MKLSQCNGHFFAYWYKDKVILDWYKDKVVLDEYKDKVILDGTKISLSWVCFFAKT